MSVPLVPPASELGYGYVTCRVIRRVAVLGAMSVGIVPNTGYDYARAGAGGLTS